MKEDVMARAAPWRLTTHVNLLRSLREHAPSDGITVVGLDGRGGSGKTSLAAVLARIDNGVSVVHTDDIAWHHSFFDWTQLLVDGVLAPLRLTGPPITYRPPGWIAHNRPGGIEIDANCSVLIVEGVGACRRILGPWLNVQVWVHARQSVGRRRMMDRKVDSAQFFHDWMVQEDAFLADDQPWQRAHFLVDGEHPAARADISGTVSMAIGAVKKNTLARAATAERLGRGVRRPPA